MGTHDSYDYIYAGDITPPKGERVWVVYMDKKYNPRYFVTSKESRDYYYLYKVEGDRKYKKMGRARTPIEFEEKYGNDELLGNKS